MGGYAGLTVTITALPWQHWRGWQHPERSRLAGRRVRCSPPPAPAVPPACRHPRHRTGRWAPGRLTAAVATVDVMASRTLFRIFYRLGFTPWDGHPIPLRLLDLVEGTATSPALPPGAALDLGCGTGDISIYLAEHGWRVTGVDFVAAALRKARRKAALRGVAVDLLQADVTRLSRAALPTDYSLIIDTGCLHNLPADRRGAYAREVTAAATAGAHLFIVGYSPNTQRGVFGISEDDLRRLVQPDWTQLSTDGLADVSANGVSLREYLFQKQPSRPTRDAAN